MPVITKPSLPENFFQQDLSYVFVHRDSDGLGGVKLHPSELALVSSFKSRTKQESFILGRKASFLALSQIGVSAPVLRGDFDEPLWPKGVVGSISHSGEFAICVVSKSSFISGIGIDIECATNKIDPRIAKRICTGSEIEKLPQSEKERVEKLLKIFSAKEAYYKAVFPRLRKFLGFRDVELVWNGNEFEGKIVNPKFGVECFASGKVGQGSCLVSVCYQGIVE